MFTSVFSAGVTFKEEGCWTRSMEKGGRPVDSPGVAFAPHALTNTVPTPATSRPHALRPRRGRPPAPGRAKRARPHLALLLLAARRHPASWSRLGPPRSPVAKRRSSAPRLPPPPLPLCRCAAAAPARACLRPVLAYLRPRLASSLWHRPATAARPLALAPATPLRITPPTAACPAARASLSLPSTLATSATPCARAPPSPALAAAANCGPDSKTDVAAGAPSDYAVYDPSFLLEQPAFAPHALTNAVPTPATSCPHALRPRRGRPPALGRAKRARARTSLYCCLLLAARRHPRVLVAPRTTPVTRRQAPQLRAPAPPASAAALPLRCSRACLRPVLAYLRPRLASSVWRRPATAARPLALAPATPLRITPATAACPAARASLPLPPALATPAAPSAPAPPSPALAAAANCGPGQSAPGSASTGAHARTRFPIPARLFGP
nr:ice-structuring glycoprotein-like [Aegilops tauschii subsp. strangulata]